MPRKARPLITDACTENQVTAQVLDAARVWAIPLERQNVGLAFNGKGQPVKFNEAGDADYRGTVPGGPSRGRRLAVEMKRSDFDPTKLKPGTDKYEHFWLQVEKLRRINADGGFAFWTRDGRDAARVFDRLMHTPGLTVDIDERGYCWLVWGDE